MSHLLGEFACRLDAKGRLVVPMGLRKQLPKIDQEGLIVNRGFEKHLVMYTRGVWNDMVEELNKLNLYEKKNRAFIRYFTRGASELALDTAGRVLIPKSLLDYAGAKTEVILACQLNRLEVWAKESYDNQLDDEPENFSNLAEEVMGRVRKEAFV